MQHVTRESYQQVVEILNKAGCELDEEEDTENGLAYAIVRYVLNGRIAARGVYEQTALGEPVHKTYYVDQNVPGVEQ